MKHYITNDHHEIKQGDWISDIDGTYEVKFVPPTIYDGLVIVSEIKFDEEDPEAWGYDGERALTASQIFHSYYG